MLARYGPYASPSLYTRSGCQIAPHAGETVRDLALNIDVAPTIARIAGARVPRWVDGENLLGVLRGQVRRRTFAIEHVDGGGPPPFCAIRTRNELFVRYASGEEEYYDYRADPWEESNLAGRMNSRKRVGALRDRAKATCVPAPPGFTWSPAG